MRACPALASLIAAGLLLAGGTQSQGPAGADGHEDGVNASGTAIDKTPVSSTPGAAPDNTHVELRDPATR